MKGFSLLAALCCLVIPSVAFAANFSGVWKSREPDGVVVNLSDTGFSVSGTLNAGHFEHTLSGTHDTATKVTMQVNRRNTSDGCVTVMYGYWELIQENTARAVIIGTDGRCELSTNYQETRTFDRR
ncbi:hypothetical protein WME76_03425 [Sorangium sp. So ce119]|uniref:hypothetical protein n=1 Tax=Sorangium sp. So ce119 TaxID=3133279 RepID=UPI003F60E59C